MKILFDHPWPFSLAHGGLQIQIEQTKTALERAGMEVEYLRWWDAGQTGDLIHYFGRPASGYIEFAHAKSLKVVLAELLTGLGSRSASARFLQKNLMRGAQFFLPSAFTGRLAWGAYQKADACIALTSWEAQLMRSMFAADPSRVHIVPNGVEEVFFATPALERGPDLVCTATIHPRKRMVELAEAAALAQVPVHLIGKPYAESDPYYLRLLDLQKQHPAFVRFTPGIADRAELARIYRQARGFVLLSTMESLSLSALEAAACQCPLLLSDLPWAHTVFGPAASYVPVSAKPRDLAHVLRGYYERAPALESHFKPKTWDEVTVDLAAIYRSLDSNSR